jgi:hypothetical protein
VSVPGVQGQSMSLECEICGQECYCDQDDCGGMPQPDDCRHFKHHSESGGDGEYDEPDEWIEDDEP